VGVTRGALPFVAFTQVRNAWLRDERISYKAKGLLAYLSSHAEGYRLSQAQIVRQGTDGARLRRVRARRTRTRRVPHPKP
jgi:hypothetical protein